MQSALEFTTGVASIDEVRIDGPRPPIRAFSSGLGFTLLDIEPVAGEAEWRVPSGDEHFLCTPRVSTGEALCGVDGPLQPIKLRPQGSLLVPAGLRSQWRFPRARSGSADLFLSEALLRQGAEDAGLEAVPLTPCLQLEDEALRFMMLKAASELGQLWIGSRLLIESLALAITARLVRLHSPDREAQPIDPLEGAQMREIEDFVDAHLCEPIGLSELMVASGSDQPAFKRAFKRTAGCTPRQYVARKRFDRALELLRKQCWTVAAAAAACGYASPGQLRADFKRHMGVALKDWRREWSRGR